jgi:insulysin
LIRTIIDQFTPELLNVTVVSSTFTDEPDLQKERFYGTQHRTRKFTPAQLARWSSVTPTTELSFPAPNAFIASDFTLLPRPAADTPADPVLLRDSQMVKVWYKQDDTFLIPKASVSVVLTSPLAYATAKHCNMTRLFSDMLKDSLTEFGYDAELAGMAYSCDNTTYGIDFSVNGYNEKLSELVYAIITRMVTLKLDPARFPMIKDKYRRSLASFETGTPTDLAGYSYRIVMVERHGDRRLCFGKQ